MRTSFNLLLASLPALLLIGFALNHSPAPLAHASADFVVYADALESGWDDWSWNTTRNFNNASPVLGGSGHSISTRFDAGWAGLSLHALTPIDPQFYEAIQFSLYGGAGGTQISFYTQATDGGGESTKVNLAAPAGVWTPFTVTMAALGNPPAIARINFWNPSANNQPVFYIDAVQLTGVPSRFTGTISIDAAGPLTTVSPLLLGSNVPAWLGPAALSDSTLRARATAAGISLMRIPGGSWSDAYGWLSCERGTPVSGAFPCADWYGWAARPTDFINLLRAQHVEGMWTVNVNITAQEAAAAVAFFNGHITDTHVIGVDIHGTDWYTTGHWAALRALHGNPEPIAIRYWEFGNEVYGGKPDNAGCQAWGWEDTWTCDGTQYINGVPGHEGYLAFRAAMRAVDPAIQFGVSGIEDPAGYGDWGNKVIAAAGDAMDFYVIHPYAYNALPPNTPSGYAQILALPQSHWRSIRTALDAAFTAHASGRAIPVYVTEYNLTSSWTNDNETLMTRTVNALFIADSIGQMMQNGFAAAAQWDLSNGGAASNGTDYGLFAEGPDFARNPQYYAFPLWSRFGHTLLPISASANAATELSVYAGKPSDSVVTLLAINKTGGPFTTTITLNGVSALAGGTADVLTAPSLASRNVTFNGVANPNADLSNAPSQPITTASGNVFDYTFAPNSVTLLKLNVVNIPLDAKLFLPLLQR